MGIFSQLFSKENDPQSTAKLYLGRYSDAYKLAEKYHHWDEAVKKFEDQEYMNSLHLLFNYLRDDDEQNVHFTEEDGIFRFEILQGSKKLVGYANDTLLKAEVKIAKTKELSIGFLRRLVEANFSLKYGRYALDEAQNITMVFDSYLLDASPYKLYYALKEIATHADKLDDLLLDEFEYLEHINTGHTIPISEKEKKIKYDFLQREIQSVFEEINTSKLNYDQYPSAVSYLYLSLAYKLDFLIRPEGFVMESIERMHRIFFSSDQKTTAEKNKLVRKELNKIANRTEEQIYGELYHTVSSFGITNPATHERLVNLIESEMANLNWYMENNHTKVAKSIIVYLCSYCLFNYALPKPERDLLELLIRIMEHEYFSELHPEAPAFVENGKLEYRDIKKEIDKVYRTNKEKYPYFKPNMKHLQYNDLCVFGRSYLHMLSALDLRKKH